jgi:hypothetical protein
LKEHLKNKKLIRSKTKPAKKEKKNGFEIFIEQYGRLNFAFLGMFIPFYCFSVKD